jgi:hypothetical protein
MTAIGKIFVIINLLFSLIVAGLITMVYAGSIRWHDAADKWKTAKDTAELSRAAAEGDLQTLRTNVATQLGQKDAEITKAVKERDAALASLQEKATELEKFKMAGNKEGSSFLALQSEVDKRKEEVATLEKQVSDKDKQIVGLIETKNKANDERVAAEIKANSYQGKAERLEARLRETEVEIAKLKRAGGAGAATTALVSTANPPSQYVEGIVTETTQRGDLLRISIGSDAGLARGNTLDVYRLKPSPQYLGQIRLTDVRATEAVGQPVDKLKAPVQKGDLVASDVTPKK